MKNVLAKAALVMTLAVAPALAWATGPGPNALGSFGPTGGAFSDSSTIGGAFVDSYTFNLDAGAGTWYITSLSHGMYDITGFTVSLLENGVAIPGSFSSTSAPLFPGSPLTLTSWLESFGSLSAGTYTLDFSGTFGKSGGGYGGTFTLIPAVPEPSTWFAMLVGLALMATVARKRQFGG